MSDIILDYCRHGNINDYIAENHKEKSCFLKYREKWRSNNKANLLQVSPSGLIETTTPMNPTITAEYLLQPTFSPRKKFAPIVNNKGAINTML